MKVDKEKLIDLLEGKTGMDRETIGEQLDELTGRVRQSAEKGKALEIKGLGLFYYSGNGELTFDPSEELQTEINYKYAGMEPVEISRAREKSGGSIKEQAPQTDDDSSDPDWPDGISTEESAVSAGRNAKTADGLLKHEAPVPPVSASGTSKKAAEKKKKNPVEMVVATVVAILAVAVVVIVVLDTGVLDPVFGDSGTPEIAQAESPAVSGGLDSGGAAEPESVQDGGDTASESTGPEEAVEPEDTEQLAPSGIEEVELTETPEYGLHGTARSVDGRHYSIILHSIRNGDRAELIRDQLENENYRAVITAVENEEMGTMWRIGIGQFESVPDAREAVSELPRNYRENHFIGLIQ
ncbi:MAG: SPOR domain-containing protein [Balneolaceae bacterium]